MYTTKVKESVQTDGKTKQEISTQATAVSTVFYCRSFGGGVNETRKDKFVKHTFVNNVHIQHHSRHPIHSAQLQQTRNLNELLTAVHDHL